MGESLALQALDLAQPATTRYGGCAAPELSASLRALDLAQARPTRHAQRSERALQRVIDGLNGRHPLIRIGFAAAPGYGHQSASLLVARRLRALGYRGALDLVCNIAARQKLAHLLPGVSPHASSVQSFAAAQVRVLPHDVAKLRLGVGLFGGLDCPGQRSTWLDVDRCLVLQPLQWPERCCMLDRGMMRTLALPQRLGYHEALTQPPSLTGLLEHNLTGAKHLPGLLEIVRRVQSGRLDLMTVYGLHRAPPEAARHLLAGLQLAQSERAAAKPTLALLITPDPVNLDGVPRCSAAEVRRIADFARLASPQGLLACSVGNLPEPVFRALLRLSTWPPAVEGANATNFLRLARAPYLSVNDWTTQLPVLHAKDRAAYRVRAASAAISRARLQPGDAACIAALLNAGRDPHSVERAYFAALGAALWQGQDKLERGLLALGRTLKL